MQENFKQFTKIYTTNSTPLVRVSHRLGVESTPAHNKTKNFKIQSYVTY